MHHQSINIKAYYTTMSCLDFFSKIKYYKEKKTVSIILSEQSVDGSNVTWAWLKRRQVSARGRALGSLSFRSNGGVDGLVQGRPTFKQNLKTVREVTSLPSENDEFAQIAVGRWNTGGLGLMSSHT